MKPFNLEVTYQPINKTWGVLYKHGNITHNEVDENLTIAFAEMAKYIESLSEINIEYGNGEKYTSTDLLQDIVAKYI